MEVLLNSILISESKNVRLMRDRTETTDEPLLARSDFNKISRVQR